MADDDEALVDVIRRAVGKAIDDVISTHEGGFTTKWVACVETVGPDGTCGLWPMASEGARSWDTLGMLHFAIALETSALGRRHDGD